ncbi:MAG TPA: hypothetical protein VG245_08830 [Candidatus Dormibacteraeota bacterium]|nr:hypothetical protein [Candidatus Dormibacteraeota bacterium]
MGDLRRLLRALKLPGGGAGVVAATLAARRIASRAAGGLRARLMAGQDWATEALAVQSSGIAVAAIVALGLGTIAPAAPGFDSPTGSHAAVTAWAGSGALDGGAPAAPNPGADGASAVDHAAPPSVQAVLGLHLPGAGSATPEDSRLYAGAASPNYAKDHTIVALGYGEACGCRVLFRSTDGGATWDHAAGPPQGNQVVLPPGYPTDPRIFIGNAAESNVPDYMTAEFGAAFAPLAVPPGLIALSPNFNSGSQLVYTSAIGGIWTTNLAPGGAVRLLVADPSTTTSPTILAPPPGSGQELIALASSLAVAPGALPSPSDAVGGYSRMVSCAVSSSCAATGSIRFSRPATLAISPAFPVDRTVVAYADDLIAPSMDGGWSFDTIPMPVGAERVASLGLSSASGHAVVWALVMRPGGYSVDTWQLTHTGGGWMQTAPLNAASPSAGTLVVISATRVLYLPASGGLSCTADGGLHWFGRCPAERG